MRPAARTMKGLENTCRIYKRADFFPCNFSPGGGSRALITKSLITRQQPRLFPTLFSPHLCESFLFSINSALSTKEPKLDRTETFVLSATKRETLFISLCPEKHFIYRRDY